MANFLFLLILLGSLQGVIMGFVLFFGKPRQYSGRLLGLLIWIIALPGIHLYLHDKGFFTAGLLTDLIHALVPWMMISATGTLLFFYLRSIPDPNFRIGRKHLIWFFPLLIDVFPKVVEVGFIARLVPVSVIADRAGLADFINAYNQYADLPRWMAVAYGVASSYRLLRNYHVKSSETGKTNPQIAQWLRQFVNVFAAFMLVWLAYLVPYLLPQTSQVLQGTVGWFPIYIPMAIIIYWLGVKGIRSTSVLLLNPLADKKIARPVPTQQMKGIVDQLASLMKHGKPYLDPSLDLASFSNIAGVPAKQISMALNQQLGKSFTSFLNEYRVREFTSRSGDAGSLTIAGMASDCGFPSLATFQRVFKQTTGQTPSEYLRKKAS